MKNLIFFSEFTPHNCNKGVMDKCLRSQKVNYSSCYITKNVALVTMHQLKQVANSSSMSCILPISNPLPQPDVKLNKASIRSVTGLGNLCPP